jgi:phage terminase Nu1 subunit (DNA packaging protein)
VPPTTAGGLNTMTPAQQQREIQRQAREIAAAEKAAERQRREAARQQAALERERIAAEKRQARQMEQAVRTGGKVLTSRAGQDIIRGIFGTLFKSR